MRTFALLALTLPVAAQAQTPSFAKDVRPFLTKYCQECHNAKSLKGGLDLETYKSLMLGSDGGAIVVPGKPNESSMILLMQGKESPKMPPKKYAHQPKAEEIAVIAAWVSAGAKDDGAVVKVEIPDIKPKRPTQAPVTALAYDDKAKTIMFARGPQLFVADADGKLELGRAAIGSCTALAVHPLLLAISEVGREGKVVIAEGNFTLLAHKDAILDLAFDFKNQRIITSSYDTRIQIFDRNEDKPRTLKEHSDAVYGIALSPDGKRLASVSADRALKIWDVESGKLLFTQGESTDWLYAVAWSPDGQSIVTGGVDKSIRLYRVGPAGIKIAQSAFAHEGPVVKLAFSHNGKFLYSLGQDRIVKSWDPTDLSEKVVFEKMPETGLHLVVMDHAGQIAVGRYDGVVQIFDKKTGKSVREIKPGAAKKAVKLQPTSLQKESKIALPVLKNAKPAEIRRGDKVRIHLDGEHLKHVTMLKLEGVKSTIEIVAQDSKKLEAEIVIDARARAGVYKLTAENASGASPPLDLTVDLFANVPEKSANDSPGRAQKIALPASVVGKLDKAGDADYYAFDAKAGEELGVHIITKTGAKFEPVLVLSDAKGVILAESTRGHLGHRFAQAGTYVVGVRDHDLRGGDAFTYRLHLGEIPIVTSIFPLGGRRGLTATIEVRGVFLGKPTSVQVPIPKDAEVGSRIPLKLEAKPLGETSIVVGANFDAFKEATNLSTPITFNSRLEESGQANVHAFQATKGQRFVVEVDARRLGSNLDSVIEILDEQGNLVPRALLRCRAKTNVTFRDHDSVVTNIRLENWGELGIDDLLFVDGELIKIKNLPGHPDADCSFFSHRGQRLTYLDTTPTHHPIGVAMYKVSIHPPGTSFPANGFPVFPLYYRNDDGGPGYGRDSRIFFEAPAAGVYQVRIRDAHGRGGDNFGYRLTVRAPEPSFKVSFTPMTPSVAKGSGLPIAITVDRLDGFQGPVKLRWTNVPEGLQLPATTLGAEDTSTAVTLYAGYNAKAPGKSSVTLVGEAEIDGKLVRRDSTGQAIQVTEPGDLIAFADVTELALKPGGIAKITVNIERRQGFVGRVPLEVRGLPHGVKVLDLGLNGILVNPQETRRTISIYAEPWVPAMEHPIVLLAKREGKTTEHATQSVTLKVLGK